MALPPNSPYRGVAAAVSQPVSDVSELRRIASRLPQLAYRDATHNGDVTWPVYRWDTRDPTEIFAQGFRPRPQGANQPDADYCDLEWFVNDNRAPLNAAPSPRGSIFVSTTITAPEISTVWVPTVRVPPRRVPVEDYEYVEVYRYEIYAPGGIDVRRSLGRRCEYPRQQEVAFAGGISRQYIRSARLYSFTYHADGSPRFERVSTNTIDRNLAFNPNPDDTGRTPLPFWTELQRPICPAHGDRIWNVNPLSRSRRDTEAVEDGAVVEDPLCKPRHYLQSAFNSSRKDEVYLFSGHRYLLMNFAPGTTNDRIINGPKNIIESYPSLRDTIFAAGIEAAFNSSRTDEAYIFARDQYALINFAPGTTNDYIIQGPKKITDSFHSLKGTPFADGIDAAFNSSRFNEAYIFRGDQYALINFAPGSTDDYIIHGPKKITDSFHCLRGTRFADGIDAAFNSSRYNEAYIFKGEYYALINFAPGTTDDYIIQHKKITDSFYSLKNVLPMCLCSHDYLNDVVENTSGGHDEL